MKSYIPTINISSLIKNNFNTKKANQTIKQIEKACINVGFFQITGHGINLKEIKNTCNVGNKFFNSSKINKQKLSPKKWNKKNKNLYSCLLYTSPSPRDRTRSRMPSSA